MSILQWGWRLSQRKKAHLIPQLRILPENLLKLLFWNRIHKRLTCLGFSFKVSEWISFCYSLSRFRNFWIKEKNFRWHYSGFRTFIKSFFCVKSWVFRKFFQITCTVTVYSCRKSILCVITFWRFFSGIWMHSHTSLSIHRQIFLR